MTTPAQPGDWKTRPLPRRRAALAVDRSFSSEEMQAIRPGVIPAQMEDKWFIYWQDNRLHFHRSWTGICIFVARFAPDGESGRLVGAHVNRNPEQYSSTGAGGASKAGVTRAAAADQANGTARARSTPRNRR